MLYGRVVPRTADISGAPGHGFPAGAWYSVVGNVRLGAGGQTRMVLLRHRLFEAAGRRLPIVTYNPVPSYEPIRAGLRAEGLLGPDGELLNLHEDLREADLSSLPTAPAEVVTPPHRTADDRDAGYVWRRRWFDRQGDEIAWEYLRRDGSAYALTPVDRMDGQTRVLDGDSRVVMAGAGLGDLWRWWTRRLVPEREPVYLVSDSRFVAEELGLLDDPRIVLMHQMHNPHVRGRRRWDSPLDDSYASSLAHVDRLDAVNTLTERQRRDLALRFGDLPQWHVVANPVEPVPEPEPRPVRRPGRIVMIARLHPQKRLQAAVEAFALVTRADPDAVLEIYGDGPESGRLRDRATELGVADRIVFHGHDDQAAEQLWSADLAWLTSAFEGYSLFLLEARVRACPVVAFDVPYGPAEQVDPGVDGLLITDGDTSALARATLDLLADRDRLEAMRAPARERALAHGHRTFLDAWAEVARESRAAKGQRTRLDAVAMRGRGRRRELTVTGEGDLADVRVQWQSWAPGDDAPTDLTTSVVRQGDRFSVSARRAPRGHHRRLLLTWHNSTWQHDLPRGWWGR